VLSATSFRETPHRDAAPPRERRDRVPERRCLVSREALPADRLIRFVIAPDGRVVPDIDGRLPGRGLWLGASRDIVNAACAGRLFAKAARSPVVVEDGLADRLEALLARRCLDLVGLARRAGDAVAGYEKVRASLTGGKPALLLLASDSGSDGRRKLLSVAGGRPVIELFTSAELGGVFGRERTVYGAVAPGGLAKRLLAETRRLAGFRGAQAQW
jgi:predicted RNA-binding protein YlxR (DUF448 family)